MLCICRQLNFNAFIVGIGGSFGYAKALHGHLFISGLGISSVTIEHTDSSGAEAPEALDAAVVLLVARF